MLARTCHGVDMTNLNKIVGFVRGRISDDERVAQSDALVDLESGSGLSILPSGPNAKIEISQRRLLAEVAAKRGIVAELQPWISTQHAEPDPSVAGLAVPDAAAESILRFLAAPYADHPDYDPTWQV